MKTVRMILIYLNDIKTFSGAFLNTNCHKDFTFLVCV